MNFKTYLHLQEGIIVPKKLHIKKNELSYLNKLHKSITFTNIEDAPIGGSFSHKTKTMKINYHMSTPIDVIESMVNHEIIHSIQYVSSKGNFEKRVIQQTQNMNDIIDKMQAIVKGPDPVNRYDEFLGLQDELKQLEDHFNYNTHEEHMAYAYTLVKARDSLGLKSLNDVIKKVKFNDAFKLDKRILKYIGMYWQVRKEL